MTATYRSARGKRPSPGQRARLCGRPGYAAGRDTRWIELRATEWPLLMEDEMLVLTRHAGEQIQIGDDITVTILSIGRDKVSVGIVAPQATLILRSELLGRRVVTPIELDILEGD